MLNSKEPVMNPTIKNLEPVELIQRPKLEPGDLIYMLNTQTTGGHMTARLWHAQLVRRVRGRRLRQAHSSVQRGSAARAQKFPWNMSCCFRAHKALQLSTSGFMKEELSWIPLASWLEHTFRVETFGANSEDVPSGSSYDKLRGPFELCVVK